MDIGLRRKYFIDDRIDEDTLLDNPYDQFEIWFNDACRAKIDVPNRMTLSTIDDNGIPHSRSVLLRKIEKDGFTFFTKRDSTKAKEINNNSTVNVHFSWDSISRQVSINGTLEQINISEARKFFNSCTRELKLSYWLPSLEEVGGDYTRLEEKLEELNIQYDGTQIPMPKSWIGYRIIATNFEFWQGRDNYLHDRFIYTLDKDCNWYFKRITP